MSRLPAAERRKQLLDNAAELFAKHGYARATTAQLAKAAGVTEPIIYRHFASKRDLFVALIERTGKETLETWEKHLEDADLADHAVEVRVVRVVLGHVNRPTVVHLFEALLARLARLLLPLVAPVIPVVAALTVVSIVSIVAALTVIRRISGVAVALSVFSIVGPSVAIRSPVAIFVA